MMTFGFHPPFEREPVSKNQRFSYPALARKPRFDSLIVGTSSVRLLRPGQLDPLLKASFVNLAMDSAMPYEQAQIFSLFVRHHPRIRYALLGVDDNLWCRFDAAPQFTHRPFPPWMYDENRWNDLLYLCNSATVEQARRQFLNLIGETKSRQGGDGYSVFVPSESKYDLEKVRNLIYEGEKREVKPAIDPPGLRFPGDEGCLDLPHSRSPTGDVASSATGDGQGPDLPPPLSPVSPARARFEAGSSTAGV